MTDDGGTFERKEEPADPSVTDHAQHAISQFTLGEQMIAFGAVLVLLVNLLLGEILLGEYFVSEVSWLLAAAARGAHRN